MINQPIQTTCCVVGGGPAGIMLGYLLARRGVAVTVLEKHKDFFRDFRGDTVHPSTMDVLHELGLLNEFLQVPHQQITSVGGILGDFPFQVADLRRVPTRCKFIALMPQWDFLNFLASQARRFPTFRLLMQHEAVDLVRSGERVVGVEARTPEGRVQISADLVVGGDGRHSTMRGAADLDVQELGVPIDVLWFRLSRREGDPEQALGNVNYGKALILINRGDYFQAGLIVPKGSFGAIQEKGIAAFQNDLRRIAPYLGERAEEVREWEQVKLLSVQVNRLRRWYRPGLLCIGDAAHAMSPAGGVGINLAIQDAVATANLLARPLRERSVTEMLLAEVQKRREFPTRVTQRLQVAIHQRFERVVFRNPGPIKAPWAFRLAMRVPVVRHVIGRVVAVGVRPEHVAGARRQADGHRTWIKMAACTGAAAGVVMVGMRWASDGRRRGQ